MTVSREIAMAVASTEKEQQLKHIVSMLGTITQFETLHRKNHENQYTLLIELVTKLDGRSPTDAESIYAKTDYPVSISLRAYLCYALLNCLVEETVNTDLHIYINLIENLIEDALNQQAVKQWSITNDINKLQNQVASTLCKLCEYYQISLKGTMIAIMGQVIFIPVSGKTQEGNVDEQDTESHMQELNALKSEKKQLLEELVCVPNPVMVYSKANELSTKLLDETLKTRFLETVSKAWTAATL